MMKNEFEALLNKGKVDNDAKAYVNHNDYKLIEYVYNWYPNINDKQAIVDLFVIGGMTLIRDLLPRAIKMEGLDKERLALEAKRKTVVSGKDTGYKLPTYNDDI